MPTAPLASDTRRLAALGLGAAAVVYAARHRRALQRHEAVDAEIAQLFLHHCLDRAPTFSRLSELAFLLSLERRRRLEVRRLNTGEAIDFSADLPHVKHLRADARSLGVGGGSSKGGGGGALDKAAMMAARMEAENTPILKDLVLVGGGHAHAHVLLMLGMRPEPGVRVTLVSREVETPYSGMLPGHVAGFYKRDECYIDLVKLGRFAGARFVHAECVGLDTVNKRYVCFN